MKHVRPIRRRAATVALAMIGTAVLGVPTLGTSAMAQSNPAPPPPPMPPPPPPIPQPPPPAPPKKGDAGARDAVKRWRDSLADWMLWEDREGWEVGRIINDPLTTGFGNPNFLEPIAAAATPPPRDAVKAAGAPD